MGLAHTRINAKATAAHAARTCYTTTERRMQEINDKIESTIPTVFCVLSGKGPPGFSLCNAYNEQ